MENDEAICKIFEIYDYEFKLGVIRIEQWPKGLKLWVKDRYVWQSWEDDDAN